MPDFRPYTVKIKFPGDNEYIPAIRKFVSDLLIVNKFSQKCAFRSEIIIDEICNNAVLYGCPSAGCSVELSCLIFQDKIEFQVKDSGGSEEHIARLKNTVNNSDKKDVPRGAGMSAGLGIDIVRMLSEEVNLSVDDNNVTSIRVVRRREEPCETGNSRN